MQLIFKVLGLVTVFCVFSLAGFLKANALSLRAKKLRGFTRSINQLSQFIKNDGSEISHLINMCFTKNQVSLENGGISFNDSFLEKEDIALLNEFLVGLGKNDRQSEYERTRLFAKTLEKQSEEAGEKCATLSKLYSSLGVLSGVFFLIFFL